MEKGLGEGEGKGSRGMRRQRSLINGPNTPPPNLKSRHIFLRSVWGQTAKFKDCQAIWYDVCVLFSLPAHTYFIIMTVVAMVVVDTLVCCEMLVAGWLVGLGA